MNKKSISESELKVMEKIWESERMLTIAEIVAALREDREEWTYNTVAMLLTRLAEKNMYRQQKAPKAGFSISRLLAGQSLTGVKQKILSANSAAH